MITWPSSSAKAPPRTHDSLLSIYELLHDSSHGGATSPLTTDQVKGVVSRSLLFDLENFDFVIDIPTEYMHSACLGLIKRMIECTFTCGENRTKHSKRKLSSPQAFNSLIQSVKVPREFSRRARTMDFSVLKAAEFRNIPIFFFPLVIQCIETSAKERKLWLLLTFMIRGCIIPEEEYVSVNTQDIEASSMEFYSLFENLFGAKNCSYNVHVISTHLLKMRTNGPLPNTSAFCFENFYGEVRNSFVPGTQSTLKQILQTVLIKKI